MKERPILFSAPMVRALLAGTKTQTRRLCKLNYRTGMPEPELRSLLAACPYGVPGDRLWVRESWRTVWSSDEEPPRSFDASYRFWYEADAPHQDGYGKLRPSIHMPRAACRLVLEVVSVRVECLMDISEADALAEGVDREVVAGYSRAGVGRAAAFAFRDLWTSINGGDSWDANPWVWVVAFKRIGA